MANTNSSQLLKQIQSKELEFSFFMSRPQSMQRDEVYYELFEEFGKLAFSRVLSIPLEATNRALYIERNFLEKTYAHLAQKFSNPDIFKKHLEQFARIEGLVETEAAYCADVRKDKASLLEALKRHKNTVKLIADFAWGPLAVEKILAPKLHELLNIHNSVDAETFYNAFASPTKLNDFQKMRIEICEAVLSGANNRKTASYLAEKYGWYSEYSYIEKLLDQDYFEGEFAKLSKEKAKEERDRTLGELDRSKNAVAMAFEKIADEETKNIAVVVNEYTYLRTARVDLFKKLQVPARHILDLIAKLLKEETKQNWTRIDIANMSNDEIFGYLAEGAVPDFPHIHERNRVVFYRDPTGEIVIEDTARVNEYITALQSTGPKEIKGAIAFKGIAKGKVALVFSKADLHKITEDSVLVARTTMPDYTHAMEKAVAFVTEEGGITSHAAIIARELKKPCIVGTGNCTKVLKDGDLIEVDANKGIVVII